MTPQQLSWDFEQQLRLIDERNLFRNLWRAAFASGCAAYNRIGVLERQLSDARAELTRYTSRQTAPDVRTEAL